jgi:hypothetical protein
MTKDKSKTLREFEKEWARERAGTTRKAKQERFATVLEKDRLETFEDCYDLVYGLPKKDVYNIACRYVIALGIDGYSPQKIVELLGHGHVE